MSLGSSWTGSRTDPEDTALSAALYPCLSLWSHPLPTKVSLAPPPQALGFLCSPGQWECPLTQLCFSACLFLRISWWLPPSESLLDWGVKVFFQMFLKSITLSFLTVTELFSMPHSWGSTEAGHCSFGPVSWNTWAIPEVHAQLTNGWHNHKAEQSHQSIRFFSFFSLF